MKSDAMGFVITSGDLCDVAGIHQGTLNLWASSGLVVPASGGKRRGCHRVFTIAHCLAVAVGARYRDEMAQPERVAGVVRFLANRPLEQTEADLEAGRSFPVPAAMLGDGCLPGIMIAPPEESEMTPDVAALVKRLDVAAIYAEVKEKMEKLSKRPANRVGRSRGLTSKVKVCRS